MGEQVKLRIPLGIGGVESEEVVVEKLDGPHWLVCSIPALCTGVALGDVIIADPVDEILEFQAVAIPGGNSTIRLLVDPVALHHVRAQLEGLGLRVDHPLSEMLAVNIAPDSPVPGLGILLDDLVGQGVVHIAPGDQLPLV